MLWCRNFSACCYRCTQTLLPSCNLLLTSIRGNNLIEKWRQAPACLATPSGNVDCLTPILRGFTSSYQVKLCNCSSCFRWIARAILKVLVSLGIKKRCVGTKLAEVPCAEKTYASALQPFLQRQRHLAKRCCACASAICRSRTHCEKSQFQHKMRRNCVTR